MSGKPTPPRLGRGLAALIDVQVARDEQARTVQTIPIDLLDPGPFQPRGLMQQEKLEELCNSIRTRGVLQPLLARPHPSSDGRYQIVAGERRWRAAQMAALHEVPVLVRTLSDADAMAAALVENLQRQDLNPIEEAAGYRRLSDEFQMTQEQLAEAVGKSRSHVANTLRLLNLPLSVQADLRSGALTAGHARALLGHSDPQKAALTVIARGLNVRQTEDLAAEEGTRRPRGRPDPAVRDVDTIALETELTGRLGLKVSITGKGAGGKIIVRYETLDQLEGIVTLLKA